MTNERLNLTGQTIGKWKVGRLVIGKNNKSYFECTCLNCGTSRIVKGSALVSGSSKSCGCMTYEKEAIDKRNKTLHDKNVLIDGTSASLLKKICRGDLLSNNTSGCTGVSQKGNSWIAEIRYKGQYHYLGSYQSYNDAVRARKTAEDVYFGEVLKKNA